MYKLLLTLLLIIVGSVTRAQNTDFDQYLDLSKEKIHLHLNKTTFPMEDDVLFSAYVVHSSTNIPFVESRVLHVRLLDENQNTIKEQYNLIDSLGVSNGSVSLRKVKAGRYWLTAQTMYQDNFRNDIGIYKQEIIVGNKTNDVLVPAKKVFAPENIRIINLPTELKIRFFQPLTPGQKLTIDNTEQKLFEIIIKDSVSTLELPYEFYKFPRGLLFLTVDSEGEVTRKPFIIKKIKVKKPSIAAIEVDGLLTLELSNIPLETIFSVSVLSNKYIPLVERNTIRNNFSSNNHIYWKEYLKKNEMLWNNSFTARNVLKEVFEYPHNFELGLKLKGKSDHKGFMLLDTVQGLFERVKTDKKKRFETYFPVSKGSTLQIRPKNASVSLELDKYDYKPIHTDYSNQILLDFDTISDSGLENIDNLLSTKVLKLKKKKVEKEFTSKNINSFTKSYKIENEAGTFGSNLLRYGLQVVRGAGESHLHSFRGEDVTPVLNGVMVSYDDIEFLDMSLIKEVHLIRQNVRFRNQPVLEIIFKDGFDQFSQKKVYLKSVSVDFGLEPEFKEFINTNTTVNPFNTLYWGAGNIALDGTYNLDTKLLTQKDQQYKISIEGVSASGEIVHLDRIITVN